MLSIQNDFAGFAKKFKGLSADAEFERIFGFSSEIIRQSARIALRRYRESDEFHTQLSGPGSIFYHAFVEEVRASIDVEDDWIANRSADNRTAPRAYRRDGLGLAFAQGTKATGDTNLVLRLKKKLGPVTLLEIQSNSCSDLVQLSFDALEQESKARPQTLWFVVYHCEEDVVHLEVSLPVGATDDGKIMGWDKRIVLADVGMMEQPVEDRADERGEDDEPRVAISAR